MMLIIGENINASIPRIKKMILEHDEEALGDLAEEQEKAGASLIDVNVGTGEGTAEDEAKDMKWLVGLLKDRVKGNLCIDSADHKVLKAGLEAAGDRAGLINSVKATEKNLFEVLPLVSEFGVPVVALAMDEGGIPGDVRGRLKACEKVLKGASQHGIAEESIFFDPLVMPVSSDASQGMVTLETLRGIKEKFPRAKTVLALSNVSFGLPRRSLVNRAMLNMAMFLSVDALIANPLDAGLMGAVKAGNVVLGKDRHCRAYTRAVRQGALG